MTLVEALVGLAILVVLVNGGIAVYEVVLRRGPSRFRPTRHALYTAAAFVVAVYADHWMPRASLILLVAANAYDAGRHYATAPTTERATT